MSQDLTPGFSPTVEYTRAVCTCGKELSTLFYQLTARKSFEEFATATELIQGDIDNIGFASNNNPNTLTEARLSFCCLVTMRYGIREPITLISSTDQETRKYPEGLPGPLSKEKTLSWY